MREYVVPALTANEMVSVPTSVAQNKPGRR